MGKKARKSTKQAWKKSQAAREYEDSMKVVKDGEKVEKEASENLFFIDTNGRRGLAVGGVGSDRLRQRVFDDELGEPIPKEEKRKIRELKKKLEKVSAI